MTTPSSAILVEPQILHANALGTVTASYVTIRDLHQHSHTIVALGCISNAATLKSVHMPLVAFSIASFIIAAAAQSSREGGAATLCALLGIVFLLAYLMTRRASVILSLDSETLRTTLGTYGEAAKLAAAIRSASEQVPPLSIELDFKSPQSMSLHLLSFNQEGLVAYSSHVEQRFRRRTT
jgi:hypothetical protein